MKRRFRLEISQREVHSWNPFADEIVQTRNQVDVKVRYPGQKMMGRLSGLSSDRPEKGEQQEGEQRSGGERAEIKIAGWAEKAQAKAIKASGNRFEVKDRDGHPRGYFPTMPPAQARADECGGTVYDRLEGRIVYSASGEQQDDIPDQGVDAEPTAEEMDW